MTTNEHTELTLKRAYLALEAQLETLDITREDAHEALELLHTELKGWDRAWLKERAKKPSRRSARTKPAFTSPQALV